jgi:hypothetical protein
MSNPVPSRSANRVRIALAAGLCTTLVAGGVYAMHRRAVAGTTTTFADAMIDGRHDMCSGRDLKGSGVQMEVFASADLNSKPVQEGLVPVVDLNVTPSAPVAVGQTVRWSGWMKARASGKHVFQLAPGVTGTLTLSKIVVLDPSMKPAVDAGTPFEEDRFYPFTLVVPAGKAAIDAGAWLLSWAKVSQEAQPITRTYLFPPTGPIAVATPAVVASK